MRYYCITAPEPSFTYQVIPPITSVTHLGSGVHKEKEMPKKDACGKCEYGSWVMSPILKKMVYCCDYKDGCRHRKELKESIDGREQDKYKDDRL